MASLPQAIAYLIKKYPYKEELSNARVTKMLYLADWYSLINNRDQITNIDWYFDNYGPFVWDVKNAVEDSGFLESISTSNIYGQRKELFRLKKSDYEPCLGDGEMESLDHVIHQTKSLNWNEFIKLVYSTYPIASSQKYTHINLKKLAKDYRKSMR